MCDRGKQIALAMALLMATAATTVGADFRLAVRAYKDYPGMYTMVEIGRADWHLLPEVKGPWKVAHVPRKTAEELTRKGYLPGLINSNAADKDSAVGVGPSCAAPMPSSTTRRPQ